jgi:TRIAD3 protein (E3 ubiquitin-protein ligase RNF216)
MDYPSSISPDNSDDDYPFPDEYDFPEQNDFWGNNIPGENSRNGSIDRPFKRTRVRGPDGTALDEIAFGPLASPGPNSSQYPQNTNSVTPEANNTDSLLLQVLEIFPDISHKYVKDLIARHRASQLATTDFRPNNVEIALSAEAIYEEILGQTTYPKEETEKGKRKRENSEEDKNDWEDNKIHQSYPYVYSDAA